MKLSSNLCWPIILVLNGLFALITPAIGIAADYYWDANGDSAGTGGTGTWTTPNTWRNGSATGPLTSWSNGNNAYFEGTAGIVTVGATAVEPTTAFFHVTDYTLQTDASETTRTVNGALSLANGVTLNLNNATATASRNLNIGGNISGGVGINIQGNQTGSNASRINMSAANSTISSAITINQAGAGIAGIVATATGQMITGTITNNSTGRTMLGATSGNDLTLASTAIISGTAGVQFSAGPSGGAGTITLNSQSTYSGKTIFNSAGSAVVKLGVNNALSTISDVEFRLSGSNGGNLDLNGFNQEIASLTSGTNAVGGIRNNASGTTSVLTVSGNSSPAAFDLVIADNTSGTGKVALTRAGTGTLTLSNVNTYSGGTTITGGVLKLVPGGSISHSSIITVGVDQATNSALFDVVSLSTGWQMASGQTLRGTGTVRGVVGVNLGAKLAPGGTDNPGVLTITNDVTFNGTSGSRFEIRANGGLVGDGSSTSGHDQLVLTHGKLDLNSAELSLIVGYSPAIGSDRLVIINNADGVVLQGRFTGLSDGATFSAGGFSWRIYYGASADAFGGSGGNDVVLVPVPEPVGLLVLSLGLIGVIRWVKQRIERSGSGVAAIARATGNLRVAG